MKLIDKDVLTEKLWERRIKHRDFGGSPYSEYGHEDDEILSLINSLEVKELDLEKEINTQWNKFVDSEGEVEQFSEIAKRFFELGIAVSNKAQKGEEV